MNHEDTVDIQCYTELFNIFAIACHFAIPVYWAKGYDGSWSRFLIPSTEGYTTSLNGTHGEDEDQVSVRPLSSIEPAIV